MINQAKITIITPIILIPLGVILLQLFGTSKEAGFIPYIGVTCLTISACAILFLLRYFDEWFPEKQPTKSEVN